MPKKFKFVNGVMVPIEYDEKSATAAPLPVLSTPEDIQEATLAYQTYAPQAPLVIPQATVISLETTDESVLDRISPLFSRYEVPIGLLSRLLVLSEYDILIILDDSGSMNSPTDLRKYSSEYMSMKYGGSVTTKVTRWREQEDRVHLMLDFLCRIPTGDITIRFLNRPQTIFIPGKDLNAALTAHESLNAAMKADPSGGTPLKTLLNDPLNYSTKKTMIYLFTDGEPSDASKPQLQQLIIKRPNPSMTPITLVSCTENDDEVEWMKDVDEHAKFCAEVDDFLSERAEVLSKQGPGFPYTLGLWLMCLLLASLNPLDLDALDETKPLSLPAFSELLGRMLTDQEYEYYLQTRNQAFLARKQNLHHQ